MRRILCILVAAVGCVSSDGAGDEESTGEMFPEPIADECIDDVTPGSHVYSCDGLTYDTTIPDACVEEPCGVIFDVHGFTMSGQMQENNTSLRKLGGDAGYIVVQPNATPAPPASSWDPARDDPKVFDFMQRIAAAFHTDEDRVHMTGFSQGGYMTWRFACEHSDVLASVAPGAACGRGAAEDCSFTENGPARPLDILYMHGTTDALVDYSCAVQRRDAIVARYQMGSEEVLSEDGAHRWTRRVSEDGLAFEFISHDYRGLLDVITGHCYPGANDPGDVEGQLIRYHCEGDSAFHWGEAALQFFMDHPRR